MGTGGICRQRDATANAGETTDGHTGGLQWPVPTFLEPPSCTAWECDPWNDNDDDNTSARCVGHV